MKQIRVVAAIIHEDGSIFATQRGYGDYKDWWEFPGGKIEPGETPEQALVREIKEELDTEIEVGDLLTTVEYDYPEFHLSMDCFWCTVKSGRLTLLEHEAARWLKAGELDSVRWLPADEEVVWMIRKKIKEPGRKVLETERLILRRWEDRDAEDLFKYASDPDVGPAAGWPAHKSIQESLDVIRNVLSEEETYAICLKEDRRAIGDISLKLKGHTDMTDRDDECEMGFWLGKPFWGQGIMPEAIREMLRHAFEDCGMQKVWIGYYEGNTKSQRVQEKCGFRYQWRSENVDVPLMHEKRTGHVSVMTKEDWMIYTELGGIDPNS